MTKEQALLIASNIYYLLKLVGVAMEEKVEFMQLFDANAPPAGAKYSDRFPFAFDHPENLKEITFQGLKDDIESLRGPQVGYLTQMNIEWSRVWSFYGRVVYYLVGTRDNKWKKMTNKFRNYNVEQPDAIRIW